MALTDKPKATYPTNATTVNPVGGKGIEPNQQCVEIYREEQRLRNAEHRQGMMEPYDSTGWEERQRAYSKICQNERHFRDRGGATFRPGEGIER